MPASGPGFHVTSRASRAFIAWSKVAALTATPVGIVAMATTPGMPASRGCCRRVATVPLSVGGRAITVGNAPGTSRSSVYLVRPMTMSRASMRFVGFPMTLKSAGSFGVARTVGVTVAAAAADSSP